jgi:hypothetical protein
MNVPFTTEQFIDVIARYNQAYVPLQIVFYLLAVWALVLLIRNVAYASRITNGILAFFWIWMGAAYHWAQFTAINPAAWAFGAAFVIQGFFFSAATVNPALATYRVRGGWMGSLAWVFILYALVAYPVIGYLTGMGYPELITVGLPCPTTIFTFGLLLWTTNTFRKWLVIIPFIWAVIGTSAAFKFGIYQDLGLGLAGIAGTLILIFRKRGVADSPSKDASSAA